LPTSEQVTTQILLFRRLFLVHQCQRKNISSGAVSEKESDKNCESRVPESFLNPQESILLKGKSHWKGCTPKSACLHVSPAQNICFLSIHLLGCQTKCSSPKAKEA
jgi:hypothetical protein